MNINRNSTAIIIALITGLAGLGTSIVNRWTPNEMSVAQSEKMGRKSYKATKASIENVAEDVDANAKRLDILEHTIILQNRTIQFLMADVGVHSPNVPAAPKLPDEPAGLMEKRTPTRVRGAPPSYDAAQKAP